MCLIVLSLVAVMTMGAGFLADVLPGSVAKADNALIALLIALLLAADTTMGAGRLADAR